METKPFPYQLEGVKQLERFGLRALLGDDMGLGKTLQALLTIKRNDLRPVVIICPAFAKWHWQREAYQHLNLRAEVLEGMKARQLSNQWARARIVIINYDILASWLPHLLELDPEMVILDESHYIKSRNAKRTAACKELCDHAPHVLALTGTPMPNKPAELWTTLNILRPDLFPTFFPFGREFCQPQKKWYGWTFDGATNLKKLNKILRRNLMVRRRKEEVLDQLPPKRQILVPIDIEGKREYDKANKDFIRWLMENDPKKVMKALRAEALMKIGYLRRLVAKLKQKQVMQWIDSYLDNSGGKLLAFTCHKACMLYGLEDYYGKEAIVVDGDVIGKKRHRAFDRFNNDPRKRVFLGQVSAAGTVWSCKATSTVLFTELPWTPGEVNQAMDRAHGIGRGLKGMPLEVYFLVARGTIEEKIYQVLSEKQHNTSRALDGQQSEQSKTMFAALISLLTGGGR